MNAFEVSRQRAEELHAEAVRRGRDPNKPYEFACAEARLRDIEVERLKKGDVRLHGGRAVYDPAAFLILHEDSGDPFIDAFLVAHEIGHVELGGKDEPLTTVSVDPFRPSEASPIGAGRVVDYNRKQRREVQMDLFAREFLLPRSWLRSLHATDGTSAREITSRLGAPHAVVAQQLLDALLLPSITAQPAVGTVNKPLLPDQAAAASHEGSPFLLEAGPGTGKTQTLVGRVEHLLNRQVDPAKILILTFSNKAAGELSERIAVRHPAAATQIWSGTFHSFGLDIIRRFHDLLGLPPDPRLIDRSEAIELLENEYPTLELEHFKNLWDPADVLGNILAAISRAKDEAADEAAYRRCATAMRKSAVGSEETTAADRCVEVARVYDAYERLKRERQWIDLGDLVSLPVRLCESHPHVQKHLVECYQHVLVDEYQDVNRSSVRLLQAIAGDGKNLWVVGDPKQSIYRFRGASAYNMIRFDREDYPGGQRGRLATNYRSHQEVVDSYLTFAKDIPSVVGTDISLTAHRGTSGQRIECQSVETDDQEVVAVADAIERMRAQNYSYRDQAVLSTGNDRLGRFAESLERLGIPVLYLGSLFERDEIKNLLSVLSLLVDGRAMGLVRVAAMPEYHVPLADVASVIEQLKSLNPAPLHWTTIVDTLAGVSREGKKGLLQITSLLEGFDQLSQPWAVLTSVLLDRSRIAADISSSDNVRIRAKGVAIWQFMNFLRTQPHGAGLPTTRLLNRIRRLVRAGDDRELRQLPVSAQGINAVRLMTMHGSKGLEFPIVHIPGLTKSSIPRSPRSVLSRDIIAPDGLIEGSGGKSLAAMHAAIAEEQECLFFVSLSRARDRLFLYFPTKTADGKNRPHSPFIDRLGPHAVKRHSIPARTLPGDPVDLPVTVTVDGVFRVTDHQLGLYERCPRRFLYTHLLEVGGRRTETAFMLLHLAVQKAIESVKANVGQGLTHTELEVALNKVWDEYGPAKDGYADEYKRIAAELLQSLAGAVRERQTHPTPRLILSVAGCEIVIVPDQVVTDSAGKLTMRRVKTGHNSNKDENGLAAAAFHLAATAHNPDCSVEFVHLGDDSVLPVDMSDRVLGNRRKSIEEMVSEVLSGRFSLNESVTCPSCPAFFICGPVPAGVLTKKFSG